MKKIQDIINNKKKASIRDVSIERDTARPQRRESTFSTSSSNNPYTTHRSGGRSFGIWFVAILAVLFLFFSFTILFSGTKVVVTQKAETISFDTSFEAQKDSDTETLSFDIISISDTAKRSVASSGEEFVESKASGKIIVYNNYSKNSQKLIANTRFQSNDGKVYRIKDAISVPGYRVDSAGTKIPGSLEVTVHADEVGDSYNVGKTDFTIPGLKGTDQYEDFYARSKTDMTGGFKGTIKKVSEVERSSAVASMQGELRERLIKSIGQQIPEGYVLYDGAMEFVFTSGLDVDAGGGKAELTESGEVHAIVFSKEALSREIAEVELESYDKLPVEGVGLDSLLFVLDNRDKNSLATLESINFNLKGNTVLVWQFDEEKLKSDLVGKRKRDTDWVLAEYPSIIEAQIIMRPFWKRNFPDEVKKIKVVYSSAN